MSALSIVNVFLLGMISGVQTCCFKSVRMPSASESSRFSCEKISQRGGSSGYFSKYVNFRVASTAETDKNQCWWCFELNFNDGKKDTVTLCALTLFYFRWDNKAHELTFIIFSRIRSNCDGEACGLLGKHCMNIDIAKKNKQSNETFRDHRFHVQQVNINLMLNITVSQSTSAWHIVGHRLSFAWFFFFYFWQLNLRPQRKISKRWLSRSYN